jgi:thiol:disulfide interchange protein
MLALAAVVVALRSAGASVGWGFQLQEPVFLVAMCALLVAFALNLFGAYEILVDTSPLGASARATRALRAASSTACSRSLSRHRARRRSSARRSASRSRAPHP